MEGQIPPIHLPKSSADALLLAPEALGAEALAEGLLLMLALTEGLRLRLSLRLGGEALPLSEALKLAEAEGALALGALPDQLCEILSLREPLKLGADTLGALAEALGEALGEALAELLTDIFFSYTPQRGSTQ